MLLNGPNRRGDTPRLVIYVIVAGLHIGAWFSFPTNVKIPSKSTKVEYVEIVWIAAPAPQISKPQRAAPVIKIATAKPSAKNTRSKRDAIPRPPEAANVPVTTETSLPDSPSEVAGGILERSLRAVGSVDRELRNGAPGVPSSPPDTPTTRLQRGIENAYVGGGNAASFARYISPDGVSITRITRGGRATCYMSALINISPSAALGGTNNSGAKEVNCPAADAGWLRN